MAKLGFKCKLYRNTATWDSPTWSEVKCVNDFTQNTTTEKIAIPSRENYVVFQEKGQITDLSWTGKLNKSTATDGTNLAAILAASVSQSTVLDVMILDGASDTDGVTGFRCEVKVFGGAESQNVNEALYPEVTFCPCPPTSSTHVPQSVAVSDGSPQYTAIAA